MLSHEGCVAKWAPLTQGLEGEAATRVAVGIEREVSWLKGAPSDPEFAPYVRYTMEAQEP